MATFTIEQNAKQQKRLRAFDITIIALAILLLAGSFVIKGRVDEWTGIFIIPFFIVFVSSSAYNLLIKPKTRFVDINDATIGFNTALQTRAENQFPDNILDWDAVKWIKKEKNNSISLYQQSSFSKNFSLDGFTVDAQQSIVAELRKHAVARGIQLVDL